MYCFMSRNVALSDDLYKRLKREKGEKSFSEFIRSKLDSEGSISEAAGKNILKDSVLEEVKADIGKLSEGSKERMNS